jgi:uncharacterized protein YbjT (DUF2867 family)
VTDVLLTGATGHVGGRLLASFERDGIRVRCLARSPEKLAAAAADVVEGDLARPETLADAFAGIRVAYYLVHSLDAGDFEDREAAAAEAFAGAAEAAGVERLVYLGGLADAEEDELSPHMRSRRAVGRILRESGVPTLELQASIVIGAGSLSYELLRRVVEAGAALVLPSWVDSPCQPIALDDVVAYLRAAADVELAGSEAVEIGGADRLTYRELLERYAEARGLPTVVATVPTPALPLGPLERVLPEGLRAPLKLLESLRFGSTVESGRAAELFPRIEPRGVDAAIAGAGV